MELALFPIAAILLLLSGVSAPARASVQHAGTAALMRELLGTNITSVQARQPAHASSNGLAHYLSQQEIWATRVHISAEAGLHPQHAAALPHAFDRKHFHNRFGFPEGAYFALGPPLA